MAFVLVLVLSSTGVCCARFTLEPGEQLKRSQALCHQALGSCWRLNLLLFAQLQFKIPG